MKHNLSFHCLLSHLIFPAMSAPTPQSLYFGYGSNLWLSQMSYRCPNATFNGIARLKNYTWIINERGYANVVSASPHDEVWGMVYTLTPSDEERLDRNEGVPYAYTKEMLEADFWPNDAKDLFSAIDVGTIPEKTKMLVYIDRKRTEPDDPREEYIVRLNSGIDDALKVGILPEYVNRVMRKFIPSLNGTVNGELLREAQEQAVEFDTTKEALEIALDTKKSK